MMKQHTWVKRLKGQKQRQLMVLPGIIWLIVFCYIPIFWLVIAFKEYDITKSALEAPWVGLKYFKEFLSDERFYTMLKNTVGIGFYKLIVAFPIPIIFALFLNEIKGTKFKKFVQTASYLPHFIAWPILGGIILSWLGKTGIINHLMITLGLQDTPIYYIAKAEYFWRIAVISDVWKELGWNAIIYIAAIAGVNPVLYEAADIDGAGRFKKMWHITIQSIRPTIAILFILAVGNLLNGSNFEQIFVLRNNMNLDASEIVDLYIYNIGIGAGRFSYASAVSLLKAAASLILVLGANLVTKKLTKESIL